MNTWSTAWKHIRRSPYQAIAAISTVALTFIVTGLFVLLSIASAVILKYFEQKPQIVVFFKEIHKEEDIKNLENKLQQMEEVAAVKYITKFEALENYKQQFKHDPVLLEMVTADILPASLEISTTKIEYLPEISKILQQEIKDANIILPEDIVDTLTTWIKSIRIVGGSVVIFLSLVSIFTVVTVLSMKIALKKQEIEILQLVGATNSFIRSPFLLEGVLYGIVGAGIGAIVNLTFLFLSQPTLQDLLIGIPVFPIPLAFYFIFTFGLCFLGIILGMVASLVAITRYLH